MHRELHVSKHRRMTFEFSWAWFSPVRVKLIIGLTNCGWGLVIAHLSPFSAVLKFFLWQKSIIIFKTIIKGNENGISATHYSYRFGRRCSSWNTGPVGKHDQSTARDAGKRTDRSSGWCPDRSPSAAVPRRWKTWAMEATSLVYARGRSVWTRCDQRDQLYDSTRRSC